MLITTINSWSSTLFNKLQKDGPCLKTEHSYFLPSQTLHYYCSSPPVQQSIFYTLHHCTSTSFSIHTSCTKMLRTSRGTKTKSCPMACNYIPNCVKPALGFGGRGLLVSFSHLPDWRNRVSYLPCLLENGACILGKIKLLTCATVVIIRAITLFSFIHSGFARGCQLLQQQLAWPGGGGTNSSQRIQITGCISWWAIYGFIHCTHYTESGHGCC